MSDQDIEDVFSEIEIKNMLGELSCCNLGVGQGQFEDILIQEEENDSQDIQAMRDELEIYRTEQQIKEISNLAPTNYSQSQCSLEETSRVQGYLNANLNGNMNPFQQQHVHGNESMRRGYGVQHLYNLYNIQEGMYQSQEMGSYHIRNCSDSASNSIVGVQRLMSPEFSQTSVLPYQHPVCTSQAHRRTLSDQLPLHSGEDLDRSAKRVLMYKQMIHNWQPEFTQLEGEQNMFFRAPDQPYIDANGTHEAMGYMFPDSHGIHRRVQSCDGLLHSTYRNQMMPPIMQNHQGYVCGEFPYGCSDGKTPTLQYGNLGGCKLRMEDTSKKPSVRLRDKELSPKSRQRVLANRQSAKKSRDRKEKYRKDMEEEEKVLQDALQFLEQLIEEKQQKLEKKKQKNQELRKAVLELLLLQKTQQIR